MNASSLPLLLRAMHLPTIAREHDEAIRRAEAENWGYARFLPWLFEAEANDRLQRKIQRQLKEASLPAGKTLESLDDNKLPDKIRRQLPTLLEADFVRRDNLLCFGLADRGKTHLVAAIAREWICRHQLQVLFVPAFRLVTQLLAAKRDLKLPQAIHRSLAPKSSPGSTARTARCHAGHSREVCRRLDSKGLSGSWQTTNARVALRRLERAGQVRLPPRPSPFARRRLNWPIGACEMAGGPRDARVDRAGRAGVGWQPAQRPFAGVPAVPAAVLS